MLFYLLQGLCLSSAINFAYFDESIRTEQLERRLWFVDAIDSIFAILSNQLGVIGMFKSEMFELLFVFDAFSIEHLLILCLKSGSWKLNE